MEIVAHFTPSDSVKCDEGIWYPALEGWVGEYREIEAPMRLCFTWDWEELDYGVGETIVTVDLLVRGDSTEVVLTHERFATREAVDSHGEGWNSCLDRLEIVFAG